MRNFFFPLSRTPASYRMPSRPSLRAIGRILRFEWRLIAAYSAGFVLIGLGYCLITPNQYEASIQIVPGDFTTKSQGATTVAGLAGLILNQPTQADAVKRFITILYSPDLAYRLENRVPLSVLEVPPAGLAPMQNAPDKKVRAFESALKNILSEDDKKTLATKFSYRARSPNNARDFLKVAVSEGDELLRQYNLSEIRYDDTYLNNTIASAQNVDVRLALTQKLVETQLRRMEAQRAEYFSVRTLGPVEVSEGPVWPRKKLILAGMLIVGFLIGGIVALVRVQVRSHGLGDEAS